MEDKIKDIISVFIKVPSDQIGPATAIGRTVVKNSILLHRMYARLQEEGIVVDNYSQIQTFSDLLGRAGANGNGRAPGEEAGGLYEAAPAAVQVVGTRQGGASIGVDIEEIAAFPVTHDFRKEEFYKMNFSPSEIAYCILQPDAYASFAGLFTAKEAMVKAGLGVRSFHMIEIAHTPEGKPVFPGYQLSIAHAGPVAVAVAIADDGAGGRAEGINTAGSFQPQGGGQKGGRLVSWLALLLSIVAIILIFTR